MTFPFSGGPAGCAWTFGAAPAASAAAAAPVRKVRRSMAIPPGFWVIGLMRVEGRASSAPSASALRAGCRAGAPDEQAVLDQGHGSVYDDDEAGEDQHAGEDAG